MLYLLAKSNPQYTQFNPIINLISSKMYSRPIVIFSTTRRQRLTHLLKIIQYVAYKGLPLIITQNLYNPTLNSSFIAIGTIAILLALTLHFRFVVHFIMIPN